MRNKNAIEAAILNRILDYDWTLKRRGLLRALAKKRRGPVRARFLSSTGLGLCILIERERNSSRYEHWINIGLQQRSILMAVLCWFGGTTHLAIAKRHLNQKAADVWKKDVWDFQAFSQIIFEVWFSPGNEGKDGKNLTSQTCPGSPRRPSPRHPRPPDWRLPLSSSL